MIATESDRPAKEIINELREAVEAALALVETRSEPAYLYEPVRYILSGGGKRIRPVLLLITAEAFGVAANQAMPGALALEVFHNFTLVHDDIMDHASTRRGKETVHTKWDEGTAILCGDYLSALSFDLITQLETPHLPSILKVYHRMIRQLCEGQALDKEFEKRKRVTVDEYINMIDRKTGALIQAAFEIAGLLGNAASHTVQKLNDLGLHVGRAFQIQDDLLDLTAENAKWGKIVGGDLVEGKKAYLLLRALESEDATVATFFSQIVEDAGLNPEKIPEAKTLLAHAGILEDAKQAVLYHSAAAQNCLDALPASSSTEVLRTLILSLQARMH